MRAVLPGKPRATQNAVCTARWAGRRIVVYISGNALIILDRPDRVLQTIYHDEVDLLDAVTIAEDTGKIATCSRDTVFVYKPSGQEEWGYGAGMGVLKWFLQTSIQTITSAVTGATGVAPEKDASSEDAAARTLSWGSGEELLVGSRSLTLYDTDHGDRVLWAREQASHLAFAAFSPDAGLIACAPRYSRLVKVWRRLAFFGVEDEEAQFDFSYLPHPDVVTGVQWRRRGSYREKAAQSDDVAKEKQREEEEHEQQRHVLYTMCADQRVRIWAAMNPHGMQVLELWGEIDLRESIQPRYLDPDSTTDDRFVFFMPAGEFTAAVRAALRREGREDSPARPILEHLLDVGGRQRPEICFVLDGRGHMCAWGMTNVGSKAGRAATDIFNIALVEGFNIFQLQESVEGQPVATIVNFPSEERDGDDESVASSRYCVLLHRLGGGIAWLEGGVDEFFDPKPRRSRIHPRALWTGHEAAVEKISRTMGGRAVFSRTSDNEGSVWKQAKRADDGQVLMQHSLLKSAEHIYRTSVLAGGRFVACLHGGSISLWDTGVQSAKQLATCSFSIEGKPLCLLQLPTVEEDSSMRYLAAITSELQGIVWEANLPQLSVVKNRASTSRCSLRQLCTFGLGSNETLKYVLPVDPAGSKRLESGFLDVFAKDVALAYTETGIVTTWTAKLDAQKGRIDWLATATVSTGIENPALVQGSSTRKVALVNASRDGLSIWDTRSGQLEFERNFRQSETILDLDWTSTPDDQSIVAVGFPHRVTILAQLRYDYFNKGPAWVPIREINVRELTPHPIGDSTWLGNGNLVIGAGNQLFMYDKLIDKSDEMVTEYSVTVHEQASLDLFDLTSILNGPLPIFHPQLLAQCILSGKLGLVQRVLVNLQKVLKFYTDGDGIESSEIAAPEEFFVEGQDHSTSKVRQNNKYHVNGNGNEAPEPTSLTEDLAASLTENLARKSLPYLSSRDQLHLADLVECAATAEKQRRSMDENGLCFLLFFRQHALRQGKKQQTLDPGNGSDKDGAVVSWREFAWAYHSSSQEILVDTVTKHFGGSGKLTWSRAREAGLFVWLTDVAALRAQLECVARSEYARSELRDPVDCSLFYLALGKKNVLLGLWRMATWHREQAGTRKLLANDFSEQRWRTTAAKNAYALLGKRRFEYAAAFFLLADCLKEAVGVCANQLGDLQLAVAVARVYGGDDGPVLRGLIEERILPRAAAEGNRWMATWAFWMLGRRDVAVRAIITPVHQLLDRPSSPTAEARSWLATDPALVVLYRQLRDRSLQTLKGATEITPRAEWEFVLQIARLYDRMGCDLLALDLVRNWEFLQLPATTATTTEKTAADEVPDPRKLLRRRSSMVVADMPIPKSPTLTSKGTAAHGGLKQPPPAVFEEPSASSLLDSFGF